MTERLTPEREASLRKGHGIGGDPDCNICFLLRELDAVRAERAEAALAASPVREDVVRRIVDLYFAPWGAAKAAKWESLFGDRPFNAETAMEMIQESLTGATP